MARMISSAGNNYTDNSSPGGFWTPPGGQPTKMKHHFTWEVPLRRKPGKKVKKNTKFFVDIEKEDICLLQSGEVTTNNKFSVLADCTTLTGIEESQERSGRDCPDYYTEERYPFIFNKFSNLMNMIYDYNSVAHKIDNYIMYAYKNKNSLSSGYFPEFIYLESK